MAAINKYGPIYFKVHNKVLNGEDFKIGLNELIKICREKNILNLMFFLDNVRIYHYSNLDEVLQKKTK